MMNLSIYSLSCWSRRNLLLFSQVSALIAVNTTLCGAFAGTTSLLISAALDPKVIQLTNKREMCFTYSCSSDGFEFYNKWNLGWSCCSNFTMSLCRSMGSWCVVCFVCCVLCVVWIEFVLKFEDFHPASFSSHFVPPTSL
jgi:hypothetical protein